MFPQALATSDLKPGSPAPLLDSLFVNEEGQPLPVVFVRPQK